MAAPADSNIATSVTVTKTLLLITECYQRCRDKSIMSMEVSIVVTEKCCSADPLTDSNVTDNIVCIRNHGICDRN